MHTVMSLSLRSDGQAMQRPQPAQLHNVSDELQSWQEILLAALPVQIHMLEATFS